ncbi:MAG: thrombospondin type 3 repeat-containing protein [Chloroflexota bacterium]|nr:thrombospondin type 3 repeat-containing protein [Chloroflexota bacterium]
MRSLTRTFLALLVVCLPLATVARPVVAAEIRPVVIAQGIVNFTGDPVDWRVYEHTADPELPRDAVSAAAGFTFVDSAGLIVRDPDNGREALLSQWEAAFSNDGETLILNTEGSATADYRRIVLMPDDYVDDPGNPAAYESDGFEILDGKHEVELAIADLGSDADSVSVPASEAGLGLVFAVEGDIVVTGEDEPVELGAGEYHAVAEDVDITTSDAATVVMIRIGPTIRDVNAPLPPADATGEENDPGPLDDGVDDGEEPSSGYGSLTLQPQICGIGGTSGGCANRSDAAVLQISGAGLEVPISTTDIVPNEDGTYTLPDLPYGDYQIVNLDPGKGPYDVEGGVPDPAQPDVFYVTIGPDNPNPVVTVRRLPPPGDGVISVELYVCPDGLPLAWAEPWYCWVQLDGWDLSLTSDAFTNTLRSADAPVSGAGYTFSGLPVGYEYRLAVNAMPAGYGYLQIWPSGPVEGPVRIDLTADYSVQTWRLFAVTTAAPDLSGPDTDGDAVPDALELNVIGTDPNLVDTDGDGVWDGRELETGTDPRDPGSYWFG